MPHRQDFKGNFQAPSLPSPDNFDQGRGKLGRSGEVEGADVITIGSTEIALGTGMVGAQPLALLLSSSWWKVLCLCSRVARCPDESSHCWEWRAIKYYSHHPGSLLWDLACWHRKQNTAVISIDSPYHLEPVNEAGVSCLGSSTVSQRPGRDSCIPSYRERKASLYLQLKNEILSWVRSRIRILQLRKSLM